MASGAATVASIEKDQHVKALAERQTIRRRPSILLNDIYIRACQKWRAAGQPPGDGSRFWLEAEQELLQSDRAGQPGRTATEA